MEVDPSDQSRVNEVLARQLQEEERNNSEVDFEGRGRAFTGDAFANPSDFWVSLPAQSRYDSFRSSKVCRTVAR